MKRIDLTGQRFSKLNVLTYSHTDKGRSHWKCQCDCGNTPTVAGTDLRTGGTKSCGCYKSAKGSRSFKWKGCGDVPHTYYSCIKSGAKHRDIPFDLSISYMWKLFLQQDKRCALSGLPLTFDSSMKQNNGNASLDRIDSTIGYIEGNVQWVHKDINTMKWDIDQSHFIGLCKAVANYLN